MRITVTIYTLIMNEGIMGGLTDHDEYQRRLDGHYMGRANRAYQCNCIRLL
jgi:hypothetical protein